MSGYLVVMGLGSALLAGVISFAVAMRHGWMRAMAVPLVALLALCFVLWRASLLDFHQGMGLAAVTVVVAAPVLAGALLGIVLAARRRP